MSRLPRLADTARASKADGSLEDGDLEEAYLGMAMAGDAEPELTGNRRIDSRIQQRAALMGHGTREQRMENFERGLDRGPQVIGPRHRVPLEQVVRPHPHAQEAAHERAHGRSVHGPALSALRARTYRGPSVELEIRR